MTPQTTSAVPAVATTTTRSIGIDFCDATQLESVQRSAVMLSTSDLAPKQYQAGSVGKEKAIANCVIALDIAKRTGTAVLMVMQNLYIVQGKPSWSARFLIATVNECGRFEPIKYRLRNLGRVGVVNGKDYGDLPNLECVAYTRAKGSNEILESSPITITLAILEGWYEKSGSKWKTMPEQMLRYRAASWWTSVYAPEISMGFRTKEENEEIIEDADFVDVTQEVAREVANETASTEIDFDPETGEISESPTAKESYEAPQATAQAQEEPKAPF